MGVEIITSEYRQEVNKILQTEWNAPPVVSKGKLHNTARLPGFVFLCDRKIIGVITYNIENDECEIVTLNSLIENKGVATALIKATLAVAEDSKCKRLWLITTNDDIGAIRFYQKKGFDLAAAHINAVDISRKLKPTIPLVGMDNIPIKHELEFEIKLGK